MIIKYGCAILRAIEEKDCDLLLEMMNNPKIDKCIGTVHLPISKDHQLNWIRQYANSDKTIRLMIELTNGKTIGMVILKDIDYKNGTAEIGLKTFVHDFHDRMLNDVDDAYTAMLSFCFMELNLNCVYAYSFSDNHSSISFNRRVGFSQDGVLKQRVYTDGEYKDLVAFSFLKHDFINKV